jgi:hypothetical protein
MSYRRQSIPTQADPTSGVGISTIYNRYPIQLKKYGLI